MVMYIDENTRGNMIKGKNFPHLLIYILKRSHMYVGMKSQARNCFRCLGSAVLNPEPYGFLMVEPVNGVHIVVLLEGTEIGVAGIASRPTSRGRKRTHLVGRFHIHILAGKVADYELLMPPLVASLAEDSASQVSGPLLDQLPETGYVTG